MTVGQARDIVQRDCLRRGKERSRAKWLANALSSADVLDKAAAIVRQLEGQRTIAGPPRRGKRSGGAAAAVKERSGLRPAVRPVVALGGCPAERDLDF